MRRKVKEAEFIIQTQYAQISNAEEIAIMIGCNYNTLRQYFKRENGYTITYCLNKTRCMYAAVLLITTNWIIYKIALEVGYRNEQYFRIAFKKIYQRSPSEYRKQKAVYVK